MGDVIEWVSNLRRTVRGVGNANRPPKPAQSAAQGLAQHRIAVVHTTLPIGEFADPATVIPYDPATEILLCIVEADAPNPCLAAHPGTHGTTRLLADGLGVAHLSAPALGERDIVICRTRR